MKSQLVSSMAWWSTRGKQACRITTPIPLDGTGLRSSEYPVLLQLVNIGVFTKIPKFLEIRLSPRQFGLTSIGQNLILPLPPATPQPEQTAALLYSCQSAVLDLLGPQAQQDGKSNFTARGHPRERRRTKGIPTRFHQCPRSTGRAAPARRMEYP
jgi:hypothetical protein